MKTIIAVLGLDRIVEPISALLLALATGFITRYYSKKENEARLLKDKEEAGLIRAQKDTVVAKYILDQRDNLVVDLEKLQKELLHYKNLNEELRVKMKEMQIKLEKQAGEITYLRTSKH